jgi:hypothetical protein
MADGPFYTGSGYGDANIAVQARTIQLALDATVKNKAVIGHPVFQELMARDAALGPMMGALGVSIGLATAGAGKLSATAEGTAATATDFHLANSATVTPARRAYARKVSDFAMSVQRSQFTGELSPADTALIMLDAMGCWTNDIVDRCVALATSATYLIGTSGAPLSWGAIQDGVIDMKSRGAGGPAIGLINAKGAKDLANDGLALGGAVQFDPSTRQLMAQLFQKEYLGTHWGVDFFLNDELDTSGGDTYGIIATPGSFLLKHQPVPLSSRAFTAASLPFLTIESRRTGGGVDEFEYVSHNAVGILEQVRFAALVYKTN